MSASVSLTQTQIFTALVTVLGQFALISSIPNIPVPIIRGQVNRTPEPAQPDYVVLWPISRNRIAVNIDSWVDAQIVGSITSNVLAVSAVLQGVAAAGQSIYGAGVTPGCQITRQLTGPAGGVGTYSVTPTAPVSSETLYVGTLTSMQETEVTIQADVHGPNSADNSIRISTLFRDQFAVSAFAVTGIALSPLYTSNPRQMPFDNGEQQVEERWIIDLCMQANIGITVTQQFADALNVTITSVEAAYPA